MFCAKVYKALINLKRTIVKKSPTFLGIDLYSEQTMRLLIGILLNLNTLRKKIFQKSRFFLWPQNDPKIYKLAEKCLEISIQCLLDICHYIIADIGAKRPKDNAEAIMIMAEKKILPQEFAKKIVEMANLRNILAHSYLIIDRELIYNHIKNLSNFKEFQKYILAYIQKT